MLPVKVTYANCWSFRTTIYVSIGWKSLRKEAKITNCWVNIPLIGNIPFFKASKYKILPLIVRIINLMTCRGIKGVRF